MNSATVSHYSSTSMYKSGNKSMAPQPPQQQQQPRKSATLVHPALCAQRSKQSGPISPGSDLGPFSRSRSTGNLCQSQQQQQQQQLGPPQSQTMNGGATMQSHYPQPVPVPATSQLSSLDIEKIEMFYRSHLTHLFVGRCLVNLYFTETDLVDGGRQSLPRIADWKLTLTGVPVLVFNRGETKCRDKREIQIYLAERGTGFPLWSDRIDALSSYAVTQPTFHTMYLSADHRRMAGLSFDCPVASVDFYHQIEPIISNFNNLALSGPKSRSVKSRLFRRRRSKSASRGNSHEKGTTTPGTGENGGVWSATNWAQKSGHATASASGAKAPKKADISSPCLFQHITSVNMYNRDELPTILNPANLPPNKYCPPSGTPSPVSDYSTPEPIIEHNNNNNNHHQFRSSGSLADLHHHHHHHHHSSSTTSGSSSSASNFSY